MSSRIVNPKKIFVDKSSLHGLGVFASHKIKKDEIFEECPVLSLPLSYGDHSNLLLDYRFNWPSGTLEWEEQVVALGYGSLYNHSENPNAVWKSNYDKRVFEFSALRDIQQGEEILVYYGGDTYWNDGRDFAKIVS